jgi:acyl dehydratase
LTEHSDGRLAEAFRWNAPIASPFKRLLAYCAMEVVGAAAADGDAAAPLGAEFFSQFGVQE